MLDTQQIAEEQKINVYTPEYVARLRQINEIVRTARAAGIEIVEARLLPGDARARVVIRGSTANWRPPAGWIHCLPVKASPAPLVQNPENKNTEIIGNSAQAYFVEFPATVH